MFKHIRKLSNTVEHERKRLKQTVACRGHAVLLAAVVVAHVVSEVTTRRERAKGAHRAREGAFRDPALQPQACRTRRFPNVGLPGKTLEIHSARLPRAQWCKVGLDVSTRNVPISKESRIGARSRRTDHRPGEETSQRPLLPEP